MTTTAQALPVAIIGAGLAGLSCAQALVQAGHQVHVFDKSRGPSGRMSTRRAEDPAGPWQCDHGAQYFTARDATFRAEVARWQQAGVAALWDARLASFDGSTWSTPETPLLIRHGLLQSPDAVQLEPVEGLRHLSPSKVYE